MLEYLDTQIVKSYCTVDSAWHCVFIVLGARNFQNPNGNSVFYVGRIFLGTSKKVWNVLRAYLGLTGSLIPTLWPSFCPLVCLQ